MLKNDLRPPSWPKLPKTVFWKFLEKFFFSPNVLECYNSARKLKKLEKKFTLTNCSGQEFFPKNRLLNLNHNSPQQLVRVNFFFQIFSIFSPNYVILRHLAKKKFFQKIFKKPFLAILTMKEASNRFSTFIESCSASKILEVRWSQILDISKNVDARSFSPKIAYFVQK